MRNGFPTDDTIRQYLLGKLDNQEKLENKLSQQMFENDELSEMVDAIEDEIIEEYIDGTLNAADKKAVDEYFLRPTERKEKLRFERLLRDHFEEHPDVRGRHGIVPGPGPQLIDDGKGTALVRHWRSHFRTYSEIAFLVLFTVSTLVYVAGVRHGLQSKIEAGNNEQARLAREVAKLEKRMQELQPSVAQLTFLGPVLRDNAGAHIIEIRPYTQRIKVEIGLNGGPAAYDVRLETPAGQGIWSQTGLMLSSGRLRFEMPREGITTGSYCLLLVSPQSGRRQYWFYVKVME